MSCRTELDENARRNRGRVHPPPVRTRGARGRRGGSNRYRVPPRPRQGYIWYADGRGSTRLSTGACHSPPAPTTAHPARTSGRPKLPRKMTSSSGPRSTAGSATVVLGDRGSSGTARSGSERRFRRSTLVDDRFTAAHSRRGRLRVLGLVDGQWSDRRVRAARARSRGNRSRRRARVTVGGKGTRRNRVGPGRLANWSGLRGLNPSHTGLGTEGGSDRRATHLRLLGGYHCTAQELEDRHGSCARRRRVQRMKAARPRGGLLDDKRAKVWPGVTTSPGCARFTAHTKTSPGAGQPRSCARGTWRRRVPGVGLQPVRRDGRGSGRDGRPGGLRLPPLHGATSERADVRRAGPVPAAPQPLVLDLDGRRIGTPRGARAGPRSRTYDRVVDDFQTDRRPRPRGFMRTGRRDRLSVLKIRTTARSPRPAPGAARTVAPYAGIDKPERPHRDDRWTARRGTIPPPL